MEVRERTAHDVVRVPGKHSPTSLGLDRCFKTDMNVVSLREAVSFTKVYFFS